MVALWRSSCPDHWKRLDRILAFLFGIKQALGSSAAARDQVRPRAWERWKGGGGRVRKNSRHNFIQLRGMAQRRYSIDVSSFDHLTGVVCARANDVRGRHASRRKHATSRVAQRSAAQRSHALGSSNPHSHRRRTISQPATRDCSSAGKTTTLDFPRARNWWFVCELYRFLRGANSGRNSAGQPIRRAVASSIRNSQMAPCRIRQVWRSSSACGSLALSSRRY